MVVDDDDTGGWGLAGFGGIDRGGTVKERWRLLSLLLLLLVPPEK